jgi:hypothetical protein
VSLLHEHVLVVLNKIAAKLQHATGKQRATWNLDAPRHKELYTAATSAAAASQATAHVFAAHNPEADLPPGAASAANPLQQIAEPPATRAQTKTWCDFALVLTCSSAASGEVVLAVGECKQPSVLSLQPPQQQLQSHPLQHHHHQQLGFRQGADMQQAAELHADRADLVVRWYKDDPTVHAVLCQVFSYMVNAGVAYGVLTAVEHTWLLRRSVDAPGTLQVSSRDWACGSMHVPS